ncbi:hypothetical protein ESZ36_13450 [Colwellia demingiae]|uniref:Uncharacterized protein n=1 Tax=Colwellia demingiae TaxID=89401 RepID=A0A5C6QEQ6_9GAMM|nr:hypothetical protein [Colwellia demingiae]TWX67299.1 hypothetical protein ESZ36_13450 [Colwellia demingiae]
MSKYATSIGEDKWLSDNGYNKQDLPIVYKDKTGKVKRAYPDLMLYREEGNELIIVEYKHNSELNRYTYFEAAEKAQCRLRADRFKVKPECFIRLHSWSNSIHKQIAVLQWAKEWMKGTSVKLVIVNPSMQKQRVKILKGKNSNLKLTFNYANRNQIEMLTPHEFKNKYEAYGQLLLKDKRLEMAEYATTYITNYLKNR